MRSEIPGIITPALPGNQGMALLGMMYQFAQSERLPAQQMQERQYAQLRILVDHAVRHVPAYGGHLQHTAAASAEALTPEHFARWPVLSKEQVRKAPESYLAKQMPRGHGKTAWTYTTGSSGKPLRSLKTEVAGFFQQALTMRNYLWHGLDFSGTFVSIRPGRIRNRHRHWGPVASALFTTGPTVRLPTDPPAAELLAEVLKERPAYLQGPPTLIRELILESIRTGKKIASPSPRESSPRPEGLKLIIAFAETVPPDLRALALQHWGVKVVDLYSCAEAGTLALECPEQGSLHVMSESILLEVVRDDGSACAPGETGRVLVTTMHNFAMPLIRYDIGDMAQVGAPCACGRTLPVLAQVHGRAAQMLVDPQGNRYWPLLPYAQFSLEIAPLQQMQFRQTTPQQVEMHYVMERALTAAEIARLTERLRKVVGYPFEYTFVRSQSSLRSPGGKLAPALIFSPAPAGITEPSDHIHARP